MNGVGACDAVEGDFKSLCTKLQADAAFLIIGFLTTLVAAALFITRRRKQGNVARCPAIQHGVELRSGLRGRGASAECPTRQFRCESIQKEYSSTKETPPTRSNVPEHLNLPSTTAAPEHLDRGLSPSIHSQSRQQAAAFSARHLLNGCAHVPMQPPAEVMTGRMKSRHRTCRAGPSPAHPTLSPRFHDS